MLSNGKQVQLYSAINLDTKRDANIIGTEGRISIPRFFNAETAEIVINGQVKRIYMPFDINGFEYQSNIMSWKESIEIMRII